MPKTIEELELELKSMSRTNKLLETKLEKAEKIELEFNELSKKIVDYEKKIKETIEKENSFQKNQIFKSSNIDEKHLDIVNKLTSNIEVSALENELKKEDYSIFKSKTDMFDIEISDGEQSPEVQDLSKHIPLETKMNNYLKKFN